MSKNHFIYILQSIHPSHPNRTYLGYTVDLGHRLRQHNGEIGGGARQTHIGRPYVIAAFISGFPDRRTALQFEWRCHNPGGCKKRKTKNFDPPRYADYRKVNNRLRRYTGMPRRQKILEHVLVLDRWTSAAVPADEYPLTIHWLNAAYKMKKCPGPHRQQVVDNFQHYLLKFNWLQKFYKLVK